MAKKVRKFDDGGAITVRGNRPQENYGGNASGFNLASMPRGMSAGAPRGAVGGGGSQRLTPLTPPSGPTGTGPAIAPAVISQPQSSLGQIVGAASPSAYGMSGRFRFAKGGAVKPGKKTPPKGSTATRADGCAVKGKTRGKIT